MAEQLLIVNPRKRRRRRRRNPTANNPRRRRRRYNPRRRRRRNQRPSYVSGSAPARNPRRRRHHRYRRNPRRAFNIMGIVQDTVIPAATAAGGAIALDVVWNFLPVPAMLKVGPMRYVAKGAGAIAMGMVAGMVVPPATARAFTAGAMTVVMYEALKEMLGTFVPGLALSGAYDIDYLGQYPSSAAVVGQESDLSAYFPSNEGMGAYYETEDMGAFGEDADIYV